MRVSKDSLIWIVYSILWFVALVLPFHKVMACILIFTFGVILLTDKSDASIRIPKIIILSILFQNTILALAGHLTVFSMSGTEIFTQIPFVEICMTVGYIIVRKADRIENHIWFLVYLSVIAIYCFIGKVSNIGLILYSVRNLTVFYLAFVVGYNYLNDMNKMQKFISFYIKLTVFAGVFGIVAMLGGAKFYQAMGIIELYNVKTVGQLYLINGIPGSFYGDFFGKYYIRLASFFLEPVNYSSFNALAVILCGCTMKSRQDKLIFLFLIICNFLTFGKGGLLIAVLALLSLIGIKFLFKLKHTNKRKIPKLALFGVIVACIGFGVFYGRKFSYNFHFYTMRLTFNVLVNNIWGYGIGTAGNVKNFISGSAMAIGSETGLLNVWYQIGIGGLIVFLILHWEMIKKLIVLHNKNDLFAVFTYIPLILALVYIFQENTYSVQVITGYMLIEGGLARESNKDVYERHVLFRNKRHNYGIYNR